MTKYCNENCEFIIRCNSTLMTWYQCNGQKNFPKVELGDECTAHKGFRCMKPEMLLDIQGDMNAIKNTMNELEKLSDEEKAEIIGMFINVDLEKENEELKEQIEKMKCGENCKHSYYVNTGGCYDMKCRQTYCDCINCNDKWELRK